MSPRAGYFAEVHLLLQGARLRRLSAGTPQRLAGAFIGAGNLVLAGYCEREIAGDASGTSLGLFLLAESLLLLGVAMGPAAMTAFIVVKNTRIFSFRRGSRFLFALAWMVIEPAAAAVSVTLVFNAAILGGHGTAARIGGAAYGIMLVLVLLSAAAFALTLSGLRDVPVRRMHGALLLAASAGLVAVFAFRTPDLPPLSWAMAGMMAARNGALASSLPQFLQFWAVLIVIALAARRYT